MAIAQPQSGDTLAAIDHAALHRVIAADTSATVQSITVSTAQTAIKPSSNSTTGIQLQKVDGTNILNIDTTNARVGIGTAAPTQALQMGNDKFIAVDVNATVTASTAQSQGNGALTAQVNEISIVANDGDTVTLPAAVAGMKITIINNGANTLQIFPASGDNLGTGVDLSDELELNEVIDFVAYDDTNWKIESETEIIHATMLDEDNTNAFVITDAGTDFQCYHTNGLVAGDLAGWTFDAGGAGVSHTIDSIVNDTGGKILVTTGDNHLLAVGDIISQSNLADANYVGVFIVQTVPLDDTYTVTATWGITDTGTMDQAATLDVVTGHGGVYAVTWGISATSSTSNETVDFRIYNKATRVIGMNGRRKFSTNGDFGMGSPGTTTTTIANGDKISFALSNEDSAGNITIRNLTVFLERL